MLSPRKAGKRLSGRALAYPGDATGKLQRDPTRKCTAALLRPPCGCHRSAVRGELNGATGLVPPRLLSAFAIKPPVSPRRGSQWETCSQYRHGMRSSSSRRSPRLFSIPRRRPGWHMPTQTLETSSRSRAGQQSPRPRRGRSCFASRPPRLPPAHQRAKPISTSHFWLKSVFFIF